MRYKILSLTALLFFVVNVVVSQDSVDIVFRYSPPTPQTSVWVVGEFNGWSSSSLPMIAIGNNTFIRTVRLLVGGQPGGGVPGAYQYKFYTGSNPWPNDPLNPRFNSLDNDNSILYVKDPTIYQFIPNQRVNGGLVRTANPVISAYIFSRVGSTLDTATLQLTIDSRTYSNLGSFYNFTNKQFSFPVPDRLTNGAHKVYLTAGATKDSVTFTVQAGFVQITNLGNFTTRNPLRTLYGAVEDTSIHSLKIVRNNKDTLVATVSGGTYNLVATLSEGLNTFKAIVRDSSNALQTSDSVRYTYYINHAPNADIYISSTGTVIICSAQGTVDPDSGQTGKLSFQWSENPGNPQPLGIGGRTDSVLTISKPAIPGEYFLSLIATDPDGNKDTTQTFFGISADGSFRGGTLASTPQWAVNGRMYEMFFKSMTPAGTIVAAQGYLPYLKSLGVNILWIMPIMENAAPINNGTGPGYNIKNFYKVAPEYGTNNDFKNFVQGAHQLGMKVILDVTPNHTSYLHPFVLEAQQYRENSPYWNFYQHAFIAHNTNGLGQSITADGFVYYSGFSSQLLNYNWSDIDARSYMVDVYKWWVKEFDIDGYRFDVYWGPHRRAGNGAGNENEMGIPVRKALRKIKPSIFLLAEDDGTGVGTEVIFADKSGGVDAGYDWILYGGAIKPFNFDSPSIENLHTKYYNNNYYPGANASFLRFMENHDEERVAYQYGSYEKTMPMATTVFTVPSMPLIYSGQEVGMGLGITNFFQRTRGVINWNSPGKSILLPHYQRLTNIRAQFGAFSTQQFVRISSGNSLVYAYTRPFIGGDGAVAVNFSPTAQDIALNLSLSFFATQFQNGKPYYANDVYNDTTYSLVFSNGNASLAFHLKPYGSAVFVIADSIKRLNLPVLVSVTKDDAGSANISDFRLHQNFPNPFNPTTTIQYEVPREAFVSLKIYNILGNEIATLEEGHKKQGYYSAQWSGVNQTGQQVASGVYFARLQAGASIRIMKMILLR